LSWKGRPSRGPSRSSISSCKNRRLERLCSAGKKPANHTTMSFREKAKSFFRRTRSDSLSKSSTKGSEDSRERWPSNVYKPGEPMPRPKYRAPPKKEHKEKLESFSFTDAWRRKSFQSQYSPMGTRAPSRRNSWLSTRRKSYRSARTSSVASTETGKSGLRQREHAHGAAIATRLSTEIEQEGDDDVANGEC